MSRVVRLPNGTLVDHGCPVCECRECGPYGADADCRCTAECGEHDDWLPEDGVHPSRPGGDDDEPGRVYGPAPTVHDVADWAFRPLPKYHRPFRRLYLP